MKQGNSVAAVNLTALTLAKDLHCITIHTNVADDSSCPTNQVSFSLASFPGPQELLTTAS